MLPAGCARALSRLCAAVNLPPAREELTAAESAGGRLARYRVALSAGQGNPPRGWVPVGPWS